MVQNGSNLYIAALGGVDSVGLSGGTPTSFISGGSIGASDIIADVAFGSGGTTSNQSGVVFVTDYSAGKILEYNITGTTLLGSVSFNPNTLQNMVVDGSNLIFTQIGPIVDKYAISPTTGLLVTPGTTLPVSNLNTPTGIALANGGADLIVASFSNDEVNDYNFALGTTKTLFTAGGTGVQGLEGVAVDASGNIDIAHYSTTTSDDIYQSNGTVGNETIIANQPTNNQDDGIAIITPVPEPSSLALVLLGAGCLVMIRRVRKTA
jgi:hypothetical protein